jgi:hypothetical protein
LWLELPTAMQAVGEGHDTPLSVVEMALGICSVAQRLPFQRSTSAAPSEFPTAVQAVGDAHDTADKLLSSAPAGSSVAAIAQRLPFQRSTSAAPSEFPTAVQAVGDAHDTADSLLSVAPAGFGVATIDQPPPPRRSASVNVLPDLVAKLPTPTHEAGDPHDTADRLLPVGPRGLGVG